MNELKLLLKIFCLLLSAVVLNACSNQSDMYYDELEFTAQTLIDEPIEPDREEFTYDGKPFNIMKMNLTSDGQYVYAMTGHPNLQIDLQSGRISAMCSNPGCPHTENYSGCKAYENMQSAVATSKGIYYIPSSMDRPDDGNKVILYNNGVETTVITNTFYTDFEKENYTENKERLSKVMFSDGIMYVFGPSYFFTYNIESGQQSEPEVFSKGDILSLAVGGNNLYYSNINQELFFYDGNAKTYTKIDDYVSQVEFKNDRIYYVKYEEGIPVLYSADKNCGDVKKLIEDCYVNCCICDNCIYYQNYSSTLKKVWVCGLDGSDAKEVELFYTDEKGERQRNYDLYEIISSGFYDNVFMYSSNRNMLYVLEEGSEKCVSVSLDDYIIQNRNDSRPE